MIIYLYSKTLDLNWFMAKLFRRNNKLYSIIQQILKAPAFLFYNLAFARDGIIIIILILKINNK